MTGFTEQLRLAPNQVSNPIAILVNVVRIKYFFVS